MYSAPSGAVVLLVEARLRFRFVPRVADGAEVDGEYRVVARRSLVRMATLSGCIMEISDAICSELRPSFRDWCGDVLLCWLGSPGRNAAGG